MKKIIMILMVVLFSASVYGLACDTSFDCDTVLPEWSCDGRELTWLDYSCENNVCVSRVHSVENCGPSSDRVCRGDSVYNMYGHCDDTLGCQLKEELLEDCTDNSFTECSGYDFLTHDYSCSDGRCVDYIDTVGCDNDGNSKYCKGSELWEYDKSCDDTLGCLHDDTFVENCDDRGYYGCRDDTYLYRDFSCHHDSCQDNRWKVVESCSTDVSIECRGEEIWELTGDCNTALGCFDAEEKIEDCDLSDTTYCSGNALMTDDYSCDIASVTCTKEELLTESCEYDVDYCDGSIRMDGFGFCNETGNKCETGLAVIEDCADYDRWTGGGDILGYGDDNACVKHDHSCDEQNDQTGCIDSTSFVDFDDLDNPSTCVDVRSATQDFFCDVNTCDEECLSDSAFYVNGCSLSCGAGCIKDSDCVLDCDSNDGCYDGVYRDYEPMDRECTVDCVCEDKDCSKFTEEDDADGDGYSTSCGDCDDTRSDVNPSMFEIPGNEVDENCDGVKVCDSSASWRNHGSYVTCVLKSAMKLRMDGLIDKYELHSIVKEAAMSDIGKKPISKWWWRK